MYFYHDIIRNNNSKQNWNFSTIVYFFKVITGQKKKEVWVEIQQQFAAVGYMRAAQEIEKKWSNLTSKAKTEYSKNKRETELTG